MVYLQEIHPYCPEELDWNTSNVQKSIEDWKFEMNQNIFLSWFHTPTPEPLSQIDPKIDIQIFPYIDRPGSLSVIIRSLSGKELFKGKLSYGTLQGDISAEIAKLPGNVHFTERNKPEKKVRHLFANQVNVQSLKISNRKLTQKNG